MKLVDVLQIIIEDRPQKQNKWQEHQVGDSFHSAGESMGTRSEQI